MAAYPFKFRRRELKQLERYTNLEMQRTRIISDYHEGYTKLLLDIEKRNADYPFIKSAVAEMFSRYLGLYMLSAKDFYERFIEHPLVILAMLANEKMRPLIAFDLSCVWKDLMRSWPSSPPSHIQSFAGQTEGYWKDLKPKGTRCLIIKMESGNLIRNSGKSGEEMRADEVNGKFPILDGIDYKSNHSYHQLIFMEI